MRFFAIALALVAATASAEPARKTKPDKFARAAGDLFNLAMQAEDANDLTKAADLYKKSLQLVVHPSTIYNLAQVLERRHEINECLVHYELYLQIAPTAADASTVRAHIAEIEKRPAALGFDQDDASDPKDMYVLVDGAIIKRPGDLHKGKDRHVFDQPVANGRHAIDVVSPIGYEGSDISTSGGASYNTRLAPVVPMTGSVAFAAPVDFTVGLYDTYNNARNHGRLTLPPGKQVLAVHDGNVECPPISVDAPSNDDTIFIFIRALEPDAAGKGQACRKHEVVQVRLKF